jgi:hypothetical protein
MKAPTEGLLSEISTVKYLVLIRRQRQVHSMEECVQLSVCSTTNLVAPVTWTAVTNAAANRNGEIIAALSPSGSVIFYRLIGR